MKRLGKGSIFYYPSKMFIQKKIYFLLCLFCLCRSVFGQNNPVAKFEASPTTGFPPLLVQFTDLSTGIINSWKWDFNNDGIIDSTIQNPTYTYAKQGIYSVSLSISGPYGEDKKVINNYISASIKPGDAGSIKWSFQHHSRSSPAIDDLGNIYVADKYRLLKISPDGNRTEFTTPLGRIGTASPVIYNDTIYIASSDGYLYAFDKIGTLRWKTLLLEGGYSDGLPAIGPDGTIYICSYLSFEAKYNLHALNPDGTKKWTRSSTTPYYDSPVVDNENIVYIVHWSNYKASLEAIDKDGNLLWSNTPFYHDAGHKMPAAMNEKHIFIPAGTLNAFDYMGQLIWSAKELIREPVPYGKEYLTTIEDVVSAIVGDEVIYAGSLDGYFYCISAETGIANWKFRPSISNPAIWGTPCLGSDGTVYVLYYTESDGIKGRLYALNSDGTEKWYCILGYTNACSSSPIIKDSTLYIASDDNFYAVNVNSDSLASTPWPCLHSDLTHSGRLDLPHPHNISGQVKTIDGQGFAGVNINLSNDGGTFVTNNNGEYFISIPHGWSGIITPSKLGYSFSPSSRTYDNVGAYQTGQDYQATMMPFPTISGTVKTSNGVGIEGVTVTFSNSGGTAKTDTDGNYSHSVGYGWSGTATPTLAGYTFDPASKSYTSVTSNQAQNYAATATYTISGTVKVGETALENVAMSGLPGTVKTNASGQYSGTVNYSWTGTVTPTKTGYDFTPVNKSYAKVTADQTAQDYTASLKTYSLTIQLDPSDKGSVTKNPDKTSYTHGDSVALTASAVSGYAFSNWAGDIPTGHENDNPLTLVMDSAKTLTAKFVKAYTISGVINLSSTAADVSVMAGLADVTLTGLPGNPKTDASGGYSAAVKTGWTGTVTPTKAGCTFSPENRSYSNVTSDQSSQDYSALVFNPTISGTVQTSDGKGIEGVTITFSNNGGTKTTDANGNYSQTVSYGWSGTSTPSKTGYNFTSANRTYSNVIINQTGQNYAAALNTYSLTVQINPVGLGTVTKNPDKVSYTHGESVTLTAIPKDKYAFTNWTGDLEGTPPQHSTDNPLIVPMTANKTFTANFSTLSVSLKDAMVVYIDQNKKLRGLDSSGNNFKIIDTDPDVDKILFSPGGLLFIVFSAKQPLADGSEYLLIKADPKDNSVSSVDKSLASMVWNSDTVSPNIQFDGNSYVYYLARSNEGNLILRKYKSETDKTDLINENSEIKHWLVGGDGTVVMGGKTLSTQIEWLRQLSPSGNLSNIAYPSSVGFILNFPDGRVYSGLPSIGTTYKGVYKLSQNLSFIDNAAALNPYIGYRSLGYNPDYDVNNIASGHDASYAYGFTGWGGVYLFSMEKTQDNQMIGLTGNGSNRTVLRYYPIPEIIDLKLVDKISLMRQTLGQLIISGTKNGINTLMLYDLATKTETNLLFENIEIYHLDVLSNGSILFDGLKFTGNKYVVGMFGPAGGTSAGKISAVGYNYKELTELGGKPLSFMAIGTASAAILSVYITSPAYNDTVRGTVDIKTSVTSVNKVSKVDFYIDDAFLGTATTAPYNLAWNTSTSSEGLHTIKAKVYDELSQMAETQITVTVNNVAPVLKFSTTRLEFAAVAGGIQTSDQRFRISNAGGGVLNWTVADDAAWLTCAPTSGTGNAVVTTSVNPAGLAARTYTGTITISSTNATNSPQTIAVQLEVNTAGTTLPPFGHMDTPIDGTTGITGAIPVTGWALDDIEVTKVEIWRDAFAGETPGLWRVGDAMFVDGARPDIEQLYPFYPLCNKAGWGYMLLTYGLPAQGNGIYRLHAFAEDKEGNRVLVGSKTITCDNAHGKKPFGTIDTPAQGGEVSGSAYVNFGWVLTPMPKTVPKNGSTILVYVDGVYVGNLGTAPNVYNQYRVDVATAFPGLNNTGAPGVGGPVGAYFLDTTKYSNGIHTIAWVATDDGGAADGIGSRYFNIMNTGTTSQLNSQAINLEKSDSYESIMNLSVSFKPRKAKRGFSIKAEPEVLQPDNYGSIHVEIKEVEKVEIDLGKGKTISAYQIVGEELRPLPIGSTLNQRNGTFSWMPGAGFLGTYDLLFLQTDEFGIARRIPVKVTIRPKFEKQ